ncbi:hypothetical protein AB0H71_13635 [Nocardia sp. NPDC050697]|uniref:hypothetical protein n=1 Tax=Nocardia sp. NPDC050697 TaxID=3155158 RepID=UPI00340A5DE7
MQELTEKISINEAAIRRAKFAANTALVAFVLALVGIALIGLGLFRIDSNQDQINTLQSEQQVQTDRNKIATCAMVALFLQFEPRTLSNPAYTEEQKAEQVQAYARLRQTGIDLGCEGS